MSSTNSTDAEVALIIGRGIPEDYIQLSSGALLLYDYALTLFEDVEVFKTRGRTGPSVLLMLNRLFMALNVLAQVIMQPDWQSLVSCKMSLIFEFIPQLLLYIIWASVSGLRVYAISNRKVLLSLSIFMFSLVPVALIMFEDTRTTGFALYYLSDTETLCTDVVNSPIAVQNGCFDLVHMMLCNVTNMLHNFRVSIGSTVFPILTDAAVLLVTWWNTYTIYKQARQSKTKTYLVTVFIRDGKIHFLALLVINSVGIGIYMKDPYTSYHCYVSALTSIIISRFLLSLQAASRVDGSSEPRSTNMTVSFSASTGVRFARTQVVGNMGAEVDGSFGLSVQTSDGSHDGQNYGQTSHDSVEAEPEPHSRENHGPLQNCRLERR